MILYIHGFGSSGESFKSEGLRKCFPNEEVVSPNLKHNPKEDLELLSEIVEEHKSENILLVGTSLGAFYAYVLSRKYTVPCALVNPSMEPAESLVKHVGLCKNYNTGKLFEWTPEHVYELQEMREYVETKTNYFPHLYNIFVGGKDETLNHSKLGEKFPFVKINEYPEENHRFTNFNLLFEEFKNILVCE